MQRILWMRDGLPISEDHCVKTNKARHSRANGGGGGSNQQLLRCGLCECAGSIDASHRNSAFGPDCVNGHVHAFSNIAFSK